MFLIDAYSEEGGVDAEGQDKTRVVLKLHPRLAPYKVAVLPLVKKDGQPEKCQEIVAAFRKAGINVSYDDKQSIGKRYARHDEIGTPYCLTIDNESLADSSCTLRDRDTAKQERLKVAEAIEVVKARLEAGA
jgi:glycyl-tRNA synthetase